MALKAKLRMAREGNNIVTLGEGPCRPRVMSQQKEREAQTAVH